MEAGPMLVSSLRLIFIAGLVISNSSALWRVISHPRKPASREINRLAVICELMVNLLYLSIIWAPFTIRAFNYSLMDYVENVYNSSSTTEVTEDVAYGFRVGKVETLSNSSAVPDSNFTFSTNDENEFEKSLKFYNQNQIKTEEETYATATEVVKEKALHRAVRWAKVESGHEGTWAVVFPVTDTKDIMVKEKNPELMESGQDYRGQQFLPSFLDVDCGFQDTITTSCSYCLAFTAVIKLILIYKPLTLSTTWLAQTGYACLLTGVPVVSTLAIRYAEQIGNKFAPHMPEQSPCGYTIYNIICDAHISDSFVFLSFLEWAGLMMVLVLTVTSFLGVASNSKNLNEYKSELNDKEEGNSVMEKVAFLTGQWARDTVLALGALWSWPLKPSLILALYVIYGKHWTNIISWTSHLVVAVSVVFVPLATVVSRGTFSDDDEITRRRSKVLPQKKSLSEVFVLPPSLVVKNLPPDVFRYYNHSPPSYDEQTSSNGDFSSRQAEDEGGSSELSVAQRELSKNAGEIRNSLNVCSTVAEPTRKFVLTLPVNSRQTKDDRKIILQHEEEFSSTSYV